MVRQTISSIISPAARAVSGVNWKRGIYRLCVVGSVLWTVAAFWRAAWSVNYVYTGLKNLVPYPASQRVYDMMERGIVLSWPVWITWLVVYMVRWVRSGFRSVYDWRRCVIGSVLWTVVAFGAAVLHRWHLDVTASERVYDMFTYGLNLSFPVWIIWISGYTVRTVRWVRSGFRSASDDETGSRGQ